MDEVEPRDDARGEVRDVWGERLRRRARNDGLMEPAGDSIPRPWTRLLARAWRCTRLVRR